MNRKQRIKIQHQRERRVRRNRAKISGTAERPRLAVHRTLRHLSAQLIDDVAGKTVAAAHSREVKAEKKKPVEVAAELGSLLAERAQKAGVSAVVFDRRSYLYHGRVKAFADAAREKGLQF